MLVGYYCCRFLLAESDVGGADGFLGLLRRCFGLLKERRWSWLFVPIVGEDMLGSAGSVCDSGVDATAFLAVLLSVE